MISSFGLSQSVRITQVDLYRANLCICRLKADFRPLEMLRRGLSSNRTVYTLSISVLHVMSTHYICAKVKLVVF